MRPCPSDPWFVVGGFCVVIWTRTLRQGDSNTPQKTTLNIKCGTFMTCAAPKQMKLGPCTCLDYIYVKIIYHFIFEHRQLFISTKACFELFLVLILLQISFSCISYVISCTIVFMSLLQSNYNCLFFITKHSIRKKIQVMKYNLIKTIKRERTFGKVINL